MAPNISISGTSQLLADFNNILSNNVHEAAPRLSSVAMGLAAGMTGSYYAGVSMSSAPDVLKPILAAQNGLLGSVGGATLTVLLDRITDQLPSLTRSLKGDIESGSIRQSSEESNAAGKLKQA